MNEILLPLAPFKGLTPYYEEDAIYFFGRESEQEIIAANLMAWRLTLLFGPSGVGKSSVLRAGVAHHLQRLACESHNRSKPEFALVVFNEWRDDPLSYLAAQIQASVAGAPSGQAREPKLLPGRFAKLLRECTERLGGQLLIILDQFEEYFLYHPQSVGKNTFDVEFADAVNDLDLPIHFLISIREDALAKLDRFEGRIPNLFDNYLRLEYLGIDAAHDAISKPISRYNQLQARDAPPISIEERLVDAVLDQVRAGRLALGDAGRGRVGHDGGEVRVETPFLQLVMMRLWQEEMGAGSRWLRLETLTRLGGAERIVGTHLDSAMADLQTAEKETAARIFHYLVTPSGTKIAHTVTDLAKYSGLSEKHVSNTTKKLASQTARILRTVAAPIERMGGQRYEIFHDVLAIPILDWRSRYLAQAQIGRELLHLEEADSYNESVRRKRIGIIALVGIGVLITWWLYEQHKTKLALARILAVQAESLPANQLQLSVLLAMESQKRSGPETVDKILQQGLSLLAQPLVRLQKNQIFPTSIALSPDDRFVVTGASPNDPYLYFWDFASQTGTAKETIDETRMVEFRAEKEFIRLSLNGRAEVWSLETGSIVREIIKKEDYDKGLKAIAVSPGANLLAAMGSMNNVEVKDMDHTVRIYDVNTASEIGRIPINGNLIEFNN